MRAPPVCITPLGSPVVPEVYGMNARLSLATRGPRIAPLDVVQDRSVSRVNMSVPSNPLSLGKCCVLVTITLGCDSVTMARSK